MNGHGQLTDARSDLDAFDRLPVEIKRVMQAAPENVDAVAVSAQLAAVPAQFHRAAAVQLRDAFANWTAQLAAEAYGPDHPQANSIS